MTTIQRVPVLIVGGGGAGLTASMLLSTYGVQSLLVSALPTTSIMPKAHVLNQRAMEVFSDVGVADAIYARSTPAAQMSHTAWYLDVCGDQDAGRRIHKMECWDGGYTDPAWVAASPCRQANLPQIRLEPILRAHAEQLNPGRVLFGHELLSLEQDANGVSATIRDKSTDAEYLVRADYLLGCDGGRTVGRLIGVQLEGTRDVMRSVSIHMTADLSEWLRDDDVLIRWIVHGGPLSVLVPMGPEHWGPKSEEWVFHMNYPPELEPDFDTDEKAIAAMRERLGIPDFQPEVHVITRWRLEGLVAPTTKVGRVFLLGDAAHRHPPTGGLGLNSAVHDVYNLCWKMAHVLAGTAGRELLETYHPERFPASHATPSARSRTRSTTCSWSHRSASRRATHPSRTGATCAGSGRRVPTAMLSAPRWRARWPVSRWSSRSTTSSSASAPHPRPSSPMAAPNRRPSTTFASIGRTRAPARPFRTHGSRASVAACRFVRWRRLRHSCSSPVRRAKHGATRHGAPRPNAASAWSPFASGTWTVTGSTRGSPSCVSASSAQQVRSSCVPIASSRGGRWAAPTIRGASSARRWTVCSPEHRDRRRRALARRVALQVSGSRTKNVVPSPARLCAPIDPPCASTIAFAT
ncbi:MAG TPA: FAD-dependent monooxygenase [Polyangiaceae bacterium]|nr:FAD-dependent monooxygenase [Polyangiaceae bacterium]